MNRHFPTTVGARSWVGAAVIVALGVLLLGSTLVVGRQAMAEADQLDARVSVTEDLVDANVRTLSQAQRELLRLQVLLTQRAPVGEVRRQAAFVTQRVHESALDYQSKTLGDPALLEVAARNERRWTGSVRQEVLAAARGETSVTRVTRVLAGLEQSYNYLVSEGEIARRNQAADADQESHQLLDRTQRLLTWLGVLFTVAMGGLVLGSALLVAYNRHRARARARLEQMNSELVWYAKIVEATDSMLVATDLDGRIAWVNDAFERFTGWRQTEVLGRRPGDFLQGEGSDPGTVRTMAEAIREQRPFQVEVANYTRDGREFWVSLSVSPVADDQGTVYGFIAVQTDVTQQHEARMVLEQARQDALALADAKSAFLATMSHEIRTPLNAVLGLTDILLLTDLDDEQRDYVETAHHSGQHLLALINDVLDFSALESGRLEYHCEPFDLTELIDETVTMFASQADARGLELSARSDPRLPQQLLSDPVRLRQVLVNVIGNAVKFTDSGSVDVVTTLEGRHGQDCEVVVRVSDTGIGVPSWRIPQLFRSFVRGEPSTTRHYGGTGLGLAICRGIVEALGGTIDLESDLDAGTTVTVRLRLREMASPRAVASASSGDLPELAGLRLLVAEDDPINQKVVTRMLERMGVTPVVVGDGQAAVEAVEATDYDVVLMDVQMPVVDGVRAVRMIRERPGLRQPWVVALTANALSGDRERFLAAGMDDYVSKPVTMDALAAALQRIGSDHTAITGA